MGAKGGVGGVDGTAGETWAAHGYVVNGETLTLTDGALTDGAIVRVGDGTTAGAAFTATIAAEVTGAVQLTKTDAGAPFRRMAVLCGACQVPCVAPGQSAFPKMCRCMDIPRTGNAVMRRTYSRPWTGDSA